MASGAHCIGIDVGGSGIKGAVVDLSTGAFATDRIRVDTPQPATPDSVAKAVAEVVGGLGRAGADGRFGCTMPAVVTNGVVRTAAHIDETWIGADAAARFREATGRECVVVNDADAAGLAEVRFGAAGQHPGVVVVVTLGTGVGTGLVSGGRLVPNSELGHLEVNGKDADTWTSSAAREERHLSWKRWSRRLDAYLTQLHTVLWPDLVVLGGGIVDHADKFVPRLDPGCEVRVAKLGNRAGIVGAALLASGAVTLAKEG